MPMLRCWICEAGRGGKGKGSGNPEEWERFKANINITTKEQMMEFKENPIDKVSAIVKGRFPMLHVVGDIDTVVPVEENTAIFEAKVKAAGGNILAIHKSDVGHHPYILADPTPIIDFILRANKNRISFAALPAPGSEYRSGAEWPEGKDWWAQNEDINLLLMEKNDLDILFVGNSITQGIGGNRKEVTSKPGLESFSRIFADFKWESGGISGDRTHSIYYGDCNMGNMLPMHLK